MSPNLVVGLTDVHSGRMLQRFQVSRVLRVVSWFKRFIHCVSLAK